MGQRQRLRLQLRHRRTCSRSLSASIAADHHLRQQQQRGKVRAKNVRQLVGSSLSCWPEPWPRLRPRGNRQQASGRQAASCRLRLAIRTWAALISLSLFACLASHLSLALSFSLSRQNIHLRLSLPSLSLIIRRTCTHTVRRALTHTHAGSCCGLMSGCVADREEIKGGRRKS